MTMTYRIVVLERALLLPLSWQFSFPYTLIEYDTTLPHQIAERIAGAHIVITDHAVPDRALMQKNPQLQLIAISSTGYNHIDTDEARAQGITVCNVRDYGAIAVAEHAFMLMMALSRQLLSYQQSVHSGAWQQSPVFCYFGAPVHDLFGKTLVIVGRGSIGSALAQRATAFGMRVLYAEQKQAATCREGYVPFEEALAQADVLSLHCPLNSQTQQMMHAQAFSLMKPGSLFINVGRGGLVDEAALAHVLQNGHLGEAGIDVLTEEPPKSSSPLLSVSHPNFMITPHVAWASTEARTTLFEMLNRNINQFVAGHPENIVVG